MSKSIRLAEAGVTNRNFSHILEFMRPKQHRIFTLTIGVLFAIAAVTNVFVLSSEAVKVTAIALGLLALISAGVYMVKKAKGHYT